MFHLTIFTLILIISSFKAFSSIAPSHCKYVWSSFEKHQVAGLSGQYDIWTEQACKDKCELTQDCWNLDFNFDENSCWFGSEKNPQPLNPHETVNHWNLGRDCGACAPNCQSCNINGAGKCDDSSCDSGYMINANKTCSVACILPDCIPGTCVPGTPDTCGQCRPAFGTPTTTDKSKCVLCSTKSGCAKCTTLTQCTLCNTTALAPKKDGSGECAPCASNCKLCPTNGVGKCDLCVVGYSLQSDKTCAVKATATT